MPEQKRCKGCQQVKNAEAFHLTSKGYLRSLCKPCMNAYNRAHPPHAVGYAESGHYRTERYREFNRKRMRVYVAGPGKERVYARSRAYIKANPEKVRAWKAVERAVRAGRLTRPERCDCGRDARVTAHHDDYSRQLDVLWLCAACHKARHQWLERNVA